MKNAVKWTLPTVFMIQTMIANSAMLNIEFKFTPYVGNLKEDAVETVPGKVRVFLNNTLHADQDVQKGKAAVLFSNREVTPSVWLPAASAGPVLRRGKNTLRIEFEPKDPKLKYQASLRWASVMDEATDDGKTSTNQALEGVDNQAVQGKVTLTREFAAPFAADLPWHRYPAITALTDADKKALAELVKARVDAFKPGFAKLYPLLEGKEMIDLQAVKDSKCLDRVYEAGVRMVGPTLEQLDFALSGQQEVVLRRKDGELFRPADPAKLEKFPDADLRDLAGMTLFFLYPPKVAVARSPAGVWEVVY